MTLSLSSLQAIVFDFDGVIANSEPLHLKAFQGMLAEEGLALTPDDYYARYLGFDDVGMLQELGRDRGLPWNQERIVDLVARKGKKLDQMLHGGGILFPGAADFIRDAAAAVPIAIASGALRGEIVEILQGAGLNSHFLTIVGSGDTPTSKPSPAPYALAFDRLMQITGRELDRTRCVAIEDSRWGLESAGGAGLRCVGVTNSYAADELVGAEMVVAGLHELTLEALDALCHAPGPR